MGLTEVLPADPGWTLSSLLFTPDGALARDAIGGFVSLTVSPWALVGPWPSAPGIADLGPCP